MLANVLQSMMLQSMMRVKTTAVPHGPWQRQMEWTHRSTGRETGDWRDETPDCRARMPRGGWGLVSVQVSRFAVGVIS